MATCAIQRGNRDVGRHGAGLHRQVGHRYRAGTGRLRRGAACKRRPVRGACSPGGMAGDTTQIRDGRQNRQLANGRGDVGMQVGGRRQRRRTVFARSRRQVTGAARCCGIVHVSAWFGGSRKRRRAAMALGAIRRCQTAYRMAGIVHRKWRARAGIWTGQEAGICCGTGAYRIRRVTGLRHTQPRVIFLVAGVATTAHTTVHCSVAGRRQGQFESGIAAGHTDTAGQRGLARRQVGQVARLTRRGIWNVVVRPICIAAGRNRNNRRNTCEGRSADARSVAAGTTRRDTSVAVLGVGKRHRIADSRGGCQAAASSYVASLTGSRTGQWHVRGRRRLDRETHRRNGIGCGVRRAVALRTIARRGGRVGVNIGPCREDGKVIGIAHLRVA